MDSTSESEYKALNQDEEDGSEVSYQPKTVSFWARNKRRIVIIGGLLAISSPFAIWSFHDNIPILKPAPKWTHCGHSPEIARSRGCHYDVMIGSWMLPNCFDGELMEEFLAVRDWEFFYDSALTKIMPMETVRRGEHDHAVYATMHQHGHHCAYVWVKQFRAAAMGKGLDDLSANEHHTRHCANSMYKGFAGANASLALELKYFSCVDRMGEGIMNRTVTKNHEHMSGGY